MRFLSFPRIRQRCPYHRYMMIIVIEVAHDPDARVIRLHDGRDSLRRAQPQHGNAGRMGNRVTVERDESSNVWPGRARLRISVALPFRLWNKTRSPGFTRNRFAVP